MLAEVRARIGDTDRKLLRLLDERIELGLRAERLESAGDRTRTASEADTLEGVRSAAYGMLSRDFIAAIFRAVLDEGRRLQSARPRLGGFQGERGAWSEMASLAWDEAMVPVPCRSFGDVFDGVEQGAFDRGVVPVENSLGGDVVDVSDLLIERAVSVVGEIVLPVRQCLLALPGTGLPQLRTVYSHPQALAQCRRFIETNGLEAQPFYDTAGAARWLLFDGVRTAGVIASPLAAALYGLDIVADGVADDASNETRFVVIAREREDAGDKCSVVLTTEHRAGALAEALGLFAAHGINLSRIESRPTRVRPGTYAFLIDFMGESGHPDVRAALAALASQSVSLKVLGFYRAGGR